MEFEYDKYKYKKIKLSKSEELKEILYKIENKESEYYFSYRISIACSLLAKSTDNLPFDLKLAVGTEGNNLVKKWLNEGREENIKAQITENGIKQNKL
jgi:hypothetical protein